MITLFPSQGYFCATAVGDKFLLMMPLKATGLITSLLGNLDSLALDYCARQKVGGTSLKYFTMKQLPILPPSIYIQTCQRLYPQTLCEWLLPLVLELTYTAYDLQGFAQNCGYTGEPFRWDEARRFLLRCELDAAYFHLYGIRRDDVDYILETFPIVKRKDEQAHGEYRTKRIILDIYDAMQQAMETGTSYQTRLDPPPANGWTPPDITRQAVMEQKDGGTKEGTAKSYNNFQGCTESASVRSQPRLDFDTTE
jgi:hypothetical protein